MKEGREGRRNPCCRSHNQREVRRESRTRRVRRRFGLARGCTKGLVELRAHRPLRCERLVRLLEGFVLCLDLEHRESVTLMQVEIGKGMRTLDVRACTRG